MSHQAFGLRLAVLLVVAASSVRALEPGREIPEPLVPLEPMIGSWKGTGVPTANRLKGWAETHRWAWKFVKGNPVGLSVELEGDKTLAKGQLSFDAAAKQYRLEGTDPAGKSVTFVGSFDKAGKALTLDRVEPAPEGKYRLILRPNSNKIRYILNLDLQEPGAPQFKRLSEVGLTKEGETFAAGGSSADLPKCILTGGAATMTVSYQGKSYPVCCSGCREEFNENPEKYAKKAALMTESTAPKGAVKSASSRVGKDDGSFDGLVDEPAMPSEKAKGSSRSRPKGEATGVEGNAAQGEGDSKASARAATQLRLGQGLEKSGKTAAAVKYYQQIVKDFPDTPQAKTAAARIKALTAE